MEHRIEAIDAKKLVGKRMRMSLARNKTGELWRGFMARRKEIVNAVGTHLFSLQILHPDYFMNFNPAAEFEKWAATEVSDFNSMPTDMESMILPGGEYVVFLHKGPASEGSKSFQYIFGTWLPASDYVVDDRPHFELLGEKYKNEAPDSEEEIWIPVKRKTS